MARQNMYPSTWQKNMDVYQNFSSGLNTKASNETLSEMELPFLQNVDIADRGTLKRRKGMQQIQDYSTIQVGAKAQGMFRFFKKDGSYTDIIAKNGYLYVNGIQQTIEGITGQLQTTREMNAAQYQGKLFIATGTKLVSYDGTAFKVVAPHKPNPLEALYVGLNGLADDPQTFITNGVSTVSQIQGVKFEEDYIASDGTSKVKSIRFGTVNKFIHATAFYSKPDLTTLEFKFEKRRDTDIEGTYPIVREWSTDPKFTFSEGYEGIIQLKVSIRQQGQTVVVDEYIIPKFMVKSVKDVAGEGFYSPTIHQCNQIFVYWERLYLYGDPTENDIIYASDVQNFSYFPITHTLRFENERKEGITTIQRFRDSLIVFTNSTIQVLYGKTPTEWTRAMINSAIGCIAPKSVQSVANSLVFLSKEGVYRLKTNTYNDNNMNVEELDSAVQDLSVINDKEACSIVHDNQYHIVYPSQKRRLRYYYNIGAWTMDSSSHMTLRELIVTDGKLFGQKTDGTIIEFANRYSDFTEIYDSVIETKGFSFGQPYHPKKVKEAQIMFEDQPVTTNMTVELFIDDALISTTPLSIKATVKDASMPQEDLTDIYEIKMAGKGHYVKARFKHKEDRPITFVGLGFIFKTKKP